MAVAGGLQGRNLSLYLRIGGDFGCAVNARGNRGHLLPKGGGVLIDKTHVGLPFAQVDHHLREFGSALAAIGPM